MTRFIDTNVFLQRWTTPSVAEFIDVLNNDEYCTSVLVLAEVYHKIKRKKNGKLAHDYVKSMMSAVRVIDIIQNDLFNAIKSHLDIDINDRINIEVMKRNLISTIISFDKDFDKDKTIQRVEP